MTGWLRTGRLTLGISREIGLALCLLHALVGACSFLSPLLLAVGLRPLVDGAAANDASQAVTGAVLTGLALLLDMLAPTGYRWATIRMRERSTMVVQRRLLALSVRAPRLEHFERPEYWDRLQLLKHGAETLANGLSLVVVGPIVLIQLTATTVLLGGLHPLLFAVPVVAIPAALLNRRAEAINRNAELRTAAERRTTQDLFTLATTAAAGMEVRLYGLRQELLSRHRQAAREVHRRTEAALLRSTAVGAGGWLLFAVVYVGAVVLVLSQAVAGRSTPGDVAMALGLAGAVVSASGRLSDMAMSVMRVRTVSDHYHWMEEQVPRTPRDRLLPTPERLTRGVELHDVTFSYAGAARPSLSGFSLRLPAGSIVAVVGENGAGKSTLVKLLCGMYQPDEGQVTIDGADLAAIDLTAYRERVTAAFQDFVRFEFPLKESVGVGHPPLMGDDAAVRTALARAGAASFAERLPHGLETQLGQTWQEGVDLSGGQWQKLALARSMLRPSPLLVILDEPTASLDPQTEHALFEQMAADARAGRADGRVTMLVSHRFSTVRMADLIVVLDRGRIAEQGTHEQLVAKGGLYAELYQLQSRAYR
ncbi:ABC transporter ATP-binding protein [Nonomuraea purpurea]|uniref:ABC transporter ATP-binding protein n=1 Tax=Nonomuraea purpurea TaxID=1849276 RepID=A0ABV8GNS2_9ACTN